MEKQEKAFKELKERFTKEQFTKELVLAVLDLDKKMRIEVDTLNYTTGGILSMEYADGRWRPVAFLLKSLNKIKKNYEIHDKEILVVIRGLENWRHLLEGIKFKFKFKVWIDHKNLEYFMKG